MITEDLIERITLPMSVSVRESLMSHLALFSDYMKGRIQKLLYELEYFETLPVYEREKRYEYFFSWVDFRLYEMAAYLLGKGHNDIFLSLIYNIKRIRHPLTGRSISHLIIAVCEESSVKSFIARGVYDCRCKDKFSIAPQDVKFLYRAMKKEDNASYLKTLQDTNLPFPPEIRDDMRIFMEAVRSPIEAECIRDYGKDRLVLCNPVKGTLTTLIKGELINDIPSERFYKTFVSSSGTKILIREDQIFNE